MKKIIIILALALFAFSLVASEYELTWVKSVETLDGRDWTVYTATKADTIDTAATAMYTKPLPHTLPFDKKCILWINPEAAALDGANVPVYMYGGFSSDFALAVSNQTVTVTDGCILNGGTAIETDVQATCAVLEFDPNRTIANTANLEYKTWKVPYAGFVVLADTAFLAVSGDVIIFKLMIPPDD